METQDRQNTTLQQLVQQQQQCYGSTITTAHDKGFQR